MRAQILSFGLVAQAFEEGERNYYRSSDCEKRTWGRLPYQQTGLFELYVNIAGSAPYASHEQSVSHICQ